MDPDSTRRMVDRGRRVLRAHGDLSSLSGLYSTCEGPAANKKHRANTLLGWPVRLLVALLIAAAASAMLWRVGSAPGLPVAGASPTPVPTLVPTREPTITAAAPANTPVSGESNPPVVDRNYLPSVSVPILMYHYVRYNPDPNDTIGRNLSVAPDVFEAQMAYLSSRDYHTISMDDLDRYFREGWKLPSKPVILTFDDGYADAYDQVFPVLRKYGFKATIYVITGRVGAPDYATWEQLKEMSAEVFTIGAHTVDHPDLTQISLEDAAKEISDSKATIEQALGLRVTSFNYPSGRYNDEVVKLVQEAGFHTAVTTKPGNLHDPKDPLRLLRVRINGGRPVEDFVSSVEGQ